LAAAGYLAPAPDLHRGRSIVRCVRTTIRQLFAQQGPAFNEIASARSYLAELPSSTGSIGVIGYPRRQAPDSPLRRRAPARGGTAGARVGAPLTDRSDGMPQTDPVTYPVDFTVPIDSGGPGAGSPIGGFGGNPATDRDGHRAVLAGLGKAPVLLVHGNGGAADVRPWDLLDQKRFLLDAGYADEVIWAPSYLGTGTVDLSTPHTDNIDDVRGFLESVCAYLAVDVVDVIAHSLGCSMVYSACRGLSRQTSPIVWDQPKRWHRIGTFVALAGAFHGLGTGSVGE
jgi:hypothetical protein